MFAQNTKCLTARASGSSALRTFSSSTRCSEKTMAELLAEVPPELRIPLPPSSSLPPRSKPLNPIAAIRLQSRSPATKSRLTWGKRGEERKRDEHAQGSLYKKGGQTGVGRGIGAEQRDQREGSRLKAREVNPNGIGGFGNRNRLEISGNGSASSSTRENGSSTPSSSYPRTPRDSLKPAQPSSSTSSAKAKSESPILSWQAALSPSSSPSSSSSSSAPAPLPRVNRTQESLFGTRSLLDVGVAEMEAEGSGTGTEIVQEKATTALTGVEKATPDSALHRALLSIGSYTHLSPTPFPSSPHPNSLTSLTQTQNREVVHRFATHYADFVLAREGNVSAGQRGIVRGVVGGRLGVKA